MSELPPEIAVEPEPPRADPPQEAIRPERPRIWPEEPRAPRPQIKRPMEEWLAEFDERVKQVDARPREQPSRRRRPRGLARILPVVAWPASPRWRRWRRRRSIGPGWSAATDPGPGSTSARHASGAWQPPTPTLPHKRGGRCVHGKPAKPTPRGKPPTPILRGKHPTPILPDKGRGRSARPATPAAARPGARTAPASGPAAAEWGGAGAW